jgi:23S rRNA (cytidine1920-2'-O)/16S rRNA (cytidine1409-2'-O)-methyltransferase
MKMRLDQLVVERKLSASREQAQRLIMAGQVLCKSEVLNKPGISVDVDLVITLKETEKYVSRGGIKLEGFLKNADWNFANFTCLDVGCSTGGFTDYLLQRGVMHVVCVDVGRGILHWKLRNDPRVTLHEKQNARFLDASKIGRHFDLTVVDVSFISLRLILPSVFPLMQKKAKLVCLVKPQFEAGREEVSKGSGVIKSLATQKKCVADIEAFGSGMGLFPVRSEPCCIRGPAGNQEYFVEFEKTE